MDWLITVFTMIMGLLLRVIIPIAVTIFVVVILKWLDERWKKEADLDESAVVKVGNVGCWDINNCPAEKREQCLAYTNPDKTSTITLVLKRISILTFDIAVVEARID